MSAQTLAAVPAEDAEVARRKDQIVRVLGSLSAERQRLSSSCPVPALLEANRLAIAYWQAELGRHAGQTPVQAV